MLKENIAGRVGCNDEYLEHILRNGLQTYFVVRSLQRELFYSCIWERQERRQAPHEKISPHSQSQLAKMP